MAAAARAVRHTMTKVRQANGMPRAIFEPSGEATAAVILTHGLGDTCDGWTDVVTMYYGPALPHARFILPTAPVQPVTLNGGMPMPSWYDIESLDADRATQRCAGIEESRETIREIVAEQVEAGIPESRIVLAGFSQGGAVSLFTGLTHKKPLAGILVKSGYLAAASAIEVAPEVAKSTPVLQLHGDIDPVVRYEWAQRSNKVLKEEFKMESVELKTYAGLQHSASLPELRDATAFLQARLPVEAPSAAAAAAAATAEEPAAVTAEVKAAE